MKSILNILKHILPAVLAVVLAGCADDWLLREPDGYVNGEKTVEFDFVWPENTTRGFDEGIEVKHKFAKGDVIHVLGTFNTEALQENGDKLPGKESRYGALQFDGISWRGVANNQLTWPSIATDGVFYAYYISGSNGVLTSEDKGGIQPMLLSRVSPTSDPLYASPTKSIDYGHAVPLNFNHLCSHLTLIDLEPMVASQYFFTTTGLRESEDGDEKTFNNAFRIFLTADDTPGLEGDPVLNFEFCQVPDESYAGEIYISSPVTKDYDTEGREIATAGYFLEPGFYETFKLSYPATASSTYEYLTYDYNNVPKSEGGVEYTATPPQLDAGTTYKLTITKAPGVTINTPPDAGGWDDEGPSYEVDVEDFLKAACGGLDYTNNDGVNILEKTPNGTKLLHNVDFKGADYSRGFDDGFEPDIQQYVVFDGGLHYIDNPGSSLIRNNYGSIVNLGVRNSKINATSVKSDDNGIDRSRYGALCAYNRDMGSIENARVEGLNMTIKVSSVVTADTDGSETHNIGGAIGSNTGKVTGLGLDGTFTINVTGTDDDVTASVLIGGITGQNAGGATLSDVTMLSDAFRMTIKNSCEGPIGSYSVGGVVGESTGNLVGIILSNVTIDCSASSGVTSYIGGIAGQVSSSTVSSGIMDSCVVSGTASAGNTQPYQDLSSASYIGGIAGTDLDVPVIDCRAAVSIYGSGKAQEGVLYGTGGAFGRIRVALTGTYTFENIIAYGSVLQAPQGPTSIVSYIGNFAGIVPPGQSWDNFSNKNIVVRSFGDIRNVGGDL